ncbi:multifunctional dye peroxidase DyP2-like [Corticium candelabrum]|uniref:multifunctional dye peroxidase DyP2-like n=1 Tax=Corticium candelabrum TaxID=121492 RepID=UPI002E265434|nr:multifunctional dye peroxidase DyP2-like [Corticium candelabrum]
MRRLLAIFVLSCLSTLVATDLPSTPLNLSDPDVVSLLTNLQGNILQDHGRHYARHIFITFGSNSSASRWLVSLLSKHVTSAYEELNNKETDLFGSLLLSASGYEKLGVDESKIPSQQVFRLGMQDLDTPVRLGNFSLPNPCSDPPVEDWDEPFPEAAPDALAVVAVGGSGALRRLNFVETVIRKVVSLFGGDVIGVYNGHRIKNKDGVDEEQFGFADGISNPLFYEEDYKAALEQTTTNKFISGADPLAQLELVLVKDELSNSSVSSFAYGSYLVYRRLEENVGLFRQFGKTIQELLRKQGINVSQDDAESRMMGRRKDGVPLVHDLSGVKPDDRNTAINFNFDGDKDGAQCPFASHIRKVNPRGSSTAKNDTANKIVRRGMVYGRKSRREAKGLLFLCFQSALDVGFLVQQVGWANNEEFGEGPPPRVGLDMVIGQYLPQNPPKVEQTVWEDPIVKLQVKDCVTMRGGEYFFAPAITTLQNILDL